jgi:basic amino acid/polyamine antiporter, APA family
MTTGVGQMTRHIPPSPSESPRLRRELGLLQATSLAITDMVGIGPYITIPLLLAAMGGPQAMLGWLVGAAVAFSDGLVWAELGAALPRAGGSYNYLREAYGRAGAGRWLSFLMVWQIMFSAPLSVASGSIGFAGYFHYFAPGMPAWGGRVMAACFPLLIVALLYRRIGLIGNLSVVLASGVLVGCIWIIASGLPHFSTARLFAFPHGAFQMNWVFWAGLGHATLYALYDYFGYYNVCYLAEEIRNPGRVIPRAIVLSIATVATLYVLMTSAFLSVIPWARLLQSKFIASEYIQMLQGAAAGKVMTALLLWIAFSSVFSLLLGYSRIPYAAALDGNFFRIFARLHPEGRFPYVSLMVLGLIGSLFSLGKLSEVIGSLIATRVLIQYLPQTVGFFLLRRRQPGLARPFRMWLYPVPGVISIAGWLYVLITAAPRSLLFAGAIFLVGSAAYFLRAHRKDEWPFATAEN